MSRIRVARWDEQKGGGGPPIVASPPSLGSRGTAPSGPFCDHNTENRGMSWNDSADLEGNKAIKIQEGSNYFLKKVFSRYPLIILVLPSSSQTETNLEIKKRKKHQI